MIKAGILGVTGYTGCELIKILLKHPHVDAAYLGSRREEKPKLSEIFPYFSGILDAQCSVMDEGMPDDLDVVFSALPHTVSMQYISRIDIEKTKVIDISADYRFDDAKIYNQWYKSEHCDAGRLSQAVYGLVEVYRDKIKHAQLVANPGCYPTGALLGIAPLAKADSVNFDHIIIDAKSGVSGAGRKAKLATQFVECNESIKAYKVGIHQHTPEITSYLEDMSGKSASVVFVPHLVPMDRGILSAIYIPNTGGINYETIRGLYEKFYRDDVFIRLREKGDYPATKDVYGTNFCDIGLYVNDDTIIVITAIDNLMKGASSQAVQNMNVMFGWDEKEGLL